ncbi:MAG TPA: MFS transporter [Burkholderiales bacterium]|nr:MFS transporter [Burkholderiales bacterium]
MTTVTVVKKDGVAAIAADTLIKWGSAKESATYIANHEKILRVGESFVGVTGTATFTAILRDYFEHTVEDIRLDSPTNIFRTWNRLHGVLKERYFLMPEEDKEDALESSRMDCLIANPHGIFGVAAHRTVQEFSRFYAYGSGSDYALGAMYSAYGDPRLSADQIARQGIEAAAEFDDGTGLPATCFTLQLINP